jgi:hypothetical protein
MLYKDYLIRKNTVEFIYGKIYYYHPFPLRVDRFGYQPMQPGYNVQSYHAYYPRLWFTIAIRNPFNSSSGYEIGFKWVNRLCWRKTPVWVPKNSPYIFRDKQ